MIDSEIEVTGLNSYQALADRTAKDMGTEEMNLIHAALGVTSEAGEFADAIKAHAIYGKDLDRMNCMEELGDLLWFINLACKHLGWDIIEVMQENINKLVVRYPEKYSDQAAITRADKTPKTDLADRVYDFNDENDLLPNGDQ